MYHWTTDKPETVGEALELLHFGVVFTDTMNGEIDRVRTARRMDRCAMLLQREISKLQLELAQLNGEIPYGN
jgi:hypothetical protein